MTVINWKRGSESRLKLSNLSLQKCLTGDGIGNKHESNYNGG
jgi:hypothetical protein